MCPDDRLSKASSASDALIALYGSHDLSRHSLGRLGRALRREPAAELETPGPEPNAPPPVQGGKLDADPAAIARLCRGLGLAETDLAEAERRVSEAPRLAEREHRRCAELGATLVTILDRGYPPALHALEMPPPVLAVRGEIPRRPAIAIVGSRHADPYGLETAERLAHQLAEIGLTVVSGFAMGIDAAAHRGALAAPDGRTLAILGCGLDVDYPRGRRKLATAVSRAGAVISEFPLGYPPMAANFPIRNRLIAALSLGVLVVRATLRSGSLITARLALDLGRDVWAIPGRLHDPKAEGTNRLIRDGALLVLEARDVVESLPWWAREQLPAPAPGAGEVPGRRPPPANEEARRLLAALPGDSTSGGEELAAATGLPTARVLALLLELELGGWVRRYPGPSFSRRG